MQLRHSRLGTARSRNVTGQLEVVFSWLSTQGHRLFGPSKPAVLERATQDQ
jgi:hypothetical protein